MFSRTYGKSLTNPILSALSSTPSLPESGRVRLRAIVRPICSSIKSTPARSASANKMECRFPRCNVIVVVLVSCTVRTSNRAGIDNTRPRTVCGVLESVNSSCTAIGENSPEVRAAACARLGHLGFKIDSERNREHPRRPGHLGHFFDRERLRHPSPRSLGDRETVLEIEAAKFV